MEENNNKPEMEFPEEGEVKTKEPLSSRSMLRIIGLILGIYWIAKGFYGMITSGG